MSDKPKHVRCAIYTRKSTEEGLEQEFNSLDAQREAGEAYIKSQKHEGWELIRTKYDDGGYSGGNIERPALKRLMTDIEAGNVDIVVVYKVDRLSRSLSDFAKLVETFDKHKVSFVSVTQQFNTTTSMGMLTLNILLSFAQFEREVTGERIRDKFRASKERGMWMGGFPQLGYDIKDRNLIINETEAERVRYIFINYLTLKSVGSLAKMLDKQGYKNKSLVSKSGITRGGKALTRKCCTGCFPTRFILARSSIGTKKVYEGQHKAIISQELWEKVEAQLKNNAVKRKSRTNENLNFLLEGKCFDINNKPYTTTYTVKGKSKRYSYYINKYTNHRIRASELETAIIKSIQASVNTATENNAWLNLFAKISNKLNLSKEQIYFKWQKMIWNYDNLSLANKARIYSDVINKVVITEKTIMVRISGEKSAGLVCSTENFGNAAEEFVHSSSPSSLEVSIKDDNMEITATVRFHRYYGKKQIFDESGKHTTLVLKSEYDMTMIKALVKSYRWNKLLETGKARSIQDIANNENISRVRVTQIINLMTLSPKIKEQILNGVNSRNLKLNNLAANIPLSWRQQQQVFA